MFKRLYYKLIKKNPADMPMVDYWKTKDKVAAIITKAKEGHIIMKMEGEKYNFPTFPRGYVLFGALSKLKHEIKNQIFNESWYALEDGYKVGYVISDIKKKLRTEIPKYYEPLKFEMLPPEAMCPSAREIYRAWTKIGGNPMLRDILCLILQEDDSYRFRVQWMAEYFWFVKFFPVRCFTKALKMMEHAEVIGDMKERIRLLRRILLLILEDKNIRDKFIKLFREIKWRKVRLTKGDKYHFRGKYFKVDYKILEY